MFLLFILFLFPRLESAVVILDPAYDEYDGLELVKVMLKDEATDLAESVLSELPAGVKNLPEARLLKAKILGNQKKWESFLKLSDGMDESELDEFKIIAFHETKNWEKCISINDHNLAPLIPLKFNCAMNAGKPEIAYKILKKAPKVSNLLKMQINFLIDHGLVEEAKNIIYTKAIYLTETDLFLLLDQMKEKKLTRELLPILEFLKNLRPNNDLLLYFAQITFSQGLPHATAEAFSEVSIERPTFSFHAAEVLRDLKKHDRAEFMQFFIPDEKQLLKQKLALWLDRGKFRKISSLKRSLPRGELRFDDEANYSLAYSLMKTGQIEDVLRFLNKITKAEILPKATALQKIWESCQDIHHTCKI